MVDVAGSVFDRDTLRSRCACLASSDESIHRDGGGNAFFNVVSVCASACAVFDAAHDFLRDLSILFVPD